MFAPVSAAVEAGLDHAGKRAVSEAQLPALRLRMTNLISAQVPPFGDDALPKPAAHLLAYDLLQLGAGWRANDGGGNEVLPGGRVVW